MAPPQQRTPKISARVIRWHRLRRGGYQPPGCFPMGETTSAHCADNAPSNICSAIRRYNVETWYILQHRYITGPIRFCPETCHVGGRIISAPTAHRNIRSGNSAALCYNVVRPAENQLVKFWIHLPWRIMRPPMMHFTRSMAWIRPNRGMIPIPVNRLRTKAVGTHTAQTKQLSNRKVTMV